MNKTKYKLFLTSSAQDDIIDIFKYIFTNDSPLNAEAVYKKIQGRIESLMEFPFRGHIPPEMKEININTFLEIAVKPYRIIYQVSDNEVSVHCVLDGRIDISSLLHERLTHE